MVMSLERMERILREMSERHSCGERCSICEAFDIAIRLAGIGRNLDSQMARCASLKSVNTGGEDGLCGSCNIEQAAEFHTCPFDYDVHNDKVFHCDCCDACENECARDI